MSSLPPDPYKILGVSKDAQPAEIRSAHRKLVLKCHPDKVQDPKLKEEKQKEFQQVQQAYELLSNEAERARYDEKVKLEELRRERVTTSTSTSPPRTSERAETKYRFDVREAEPRPSTFTNSHGSHKVYGHTPPSRSFDDEIYARKFDEKPRYARKTASYEYEKPSRKDEERRRRKDDDEWNREKERAKERDREIRDAERRREREREREALREREREKEKEAAKKEKERRKDERKEDKKRTEKDRRKESDEKQRRHKSPYIEVYPDSDDQEEVVYMTSSSSKQDKKKSSGSRKYEEVPAAAPPPPRETSLPPSTTERERKNSATLESAIRYLSRSGGKPPALNRAQTYHQEYAGVRHIAPIAVPTPPPAAGSPFPPPPMATPREAPLEEETVKRSSARPRRMSHDTPRSSKEKSSHKKTGSSREPVIVGETSPTPARVVSSYQGSHPVPIPMSGSRRVPHLSRSNTDSYSRPPPAPGLERAATWMPDSGLGRERSRSRHARYTDESSEDDRERRPRRGRRMQSPEPMPQSTTKRYTVDSSMRTVPVQDHYYAEDSPRGSKKTSYATANSSARRAEPRQGYYTHDEFEDEPQSFFPNVKYSTTFHPSQVKYTEVPHTVLREEVYTGVC